MIGEALNYSVLSCLTQNKFVCSFEPRMCFEFAVNA